VDRWGGFPVIVRRIGSQKKGIGSERKQEGGGSEADIPRLLLVPPQPNFLYLVGFDFQDLRLKYPFSNGKGHKMRLFALKICGLDYFGDRIVSRETSRTLKKGKISRKKARGGKAKLYGKAVLSNA